MKTRYGLEIRAATTLDAPGLSELLREAGQPIAPQTLADRLDAMRQYPGAAFMALEYGPPSGLVILHWYRTLHAPQPTARITMLLVGQDERRRGLGRVLLKAAAQAARLAGCDMLELTASGDQADLRAFCLATGFTEADLLSSGAHLVRPLRRKATTPDV